MRERESSSPCERRPKTFVIQCNVEGFKTVIRLRKMDVIILGLYCPGGGGGGWEKVCFSFFGLYVVFLLEEGGVVGGGGGGGGMAERCYCHYSFEMWS